MFQEPAQRVSKYRDKGTPITKPINVTRDVSRSYLITKVLPAIVAKWPREARGETIWIQQDNARTHIEPNDEAFCLAVRQTGLDIRIFNQPANSPDLNVLDLSFFASLQIFQYGWIRIFEFLNNNAVFLRFYQTIQLISSSQIMCWLVQEMPLIKFNFGLFLRLSNKALLP